MPVDDIVTRRRAFGLFGAVGVGVLAAACSNDGGSSAGQSTTTTSGSAGSSGGTSSGGGSAGAACVLTPEVTEGPYYIDADLVRRDITEGKDGVPVELSITVVDANTCSPVPDAAVDIWHCDAEGIYSGYEAASTGGPGGGGGGGAQDTTRYLRGTQVTGADGVATFDTIYPGWYRGRAVHIHMKVHADSATRNTGQLFFDDDLSDSVYTAAPYSAKGTPDMRNDDDSIFADAGGESAIAALTPSGGGYRGTITVGITQS